MKKHILSAGLVACLLAVGCKKEISPDEGADLSMSSGNTSQITSQETICDVISFSSLTAGTTSVNGLTNTVTSDGGRGPIAITSFNPRNGSSMTGGSNTNVAMVFNSGSPEPMPGDKWSVDMGTKNEVFGGPGIGAAGESGPFVNNVALGNMLIMQDPRYTYPREDITTGYLAFNFSNVNGGNGITATHLTVIDLDDNIFDMVDEYVRVELYANASDVTPLYVASQGFPVGPLSPTVDETGATGDTGPNGVAIMDLNNTAGVRYIKVIISGSTAIDNLRFCIPGTPSTGCTYTQGFWKNHGVDNTKPQGDQWPVDGLTLGNPGVNYSEVQLLEILRTPTKGNGLISLAHQLIAAKLNVANGAATTTEILQLIAAADNLIANRTIGSGYLAPAVTANLTDQLAKYNEGRWPGIRHCN